MHDSRKTFLEKKSNKKLHSALKLNTRVATGLMYGLGDLVYYKRKDYD